MLLKSWAMPPVSWPTASIFWTWRSWASAASRSAASAFKRLIGFPQLLGAVAHRLLEGFGALRFAFDLAAGGGILAKRLDGDDAEEDRAEPDEDAEPAQIIGQPVGLGGKQLALLDPRAQREALGADDLVELAVKLLARSLGRRLVIIADPGIAALLERGAGGERQLVPALAVEQPQLGDSAQLPGLVRSRLLSWLIWWPARRHELA